MKKFIRLIIPILGMIAGLAILGYYPISEYLDAKKREEAAADIKQEAEETDNSQIESLLEQAHLYNQALAGEIELPEGLLDYEHQLALDDPNAAFAVLRIPAIDLTMPVYKTADTSSLAMGAGHLENSSLPVGGESTHTVLSGHSGMPNMKAFDELSKLEPGDIFGIEVFGEIYAYEVTSTEVVLPEETDSLQIVQGEDLATLITCTPYGINSHRLLVHGTRTTVSDDFWKESGQSVIEQSMSLRNAPFLIGIAVVIAVLVIIVLRKRKH